MSGWNTDRIRVALRDRHTGDAWAFLEEVPNATGARAGRRCDGLAMSLWPSRGLELHGFEIKASRSDWLSELKQPAKAETIARYCDRWWLVVGDPAIVEPGELPPEWGLLVPKGRKLIAKTKAPKMKHVDPVDKSFLAALLRCAVRQLGGEEKLREEFNRGRSEGRREASSAAEKMADQKYGGYKRTVDGLRAQIAAFEEASGISLKTYVSSHGPADAEVDALRAHGTDLGTAVRAIVGDAAGIVERRINELRRLSDRHARLAEHAGESAAALERVHTDGGAA